MDDPEPDPFTSLITTKCHVTNSQQLSLCTVALARQLDPFLDESESQYQIPVETNGIRMESPPEEDEFLTPQEDSLPLASSSEGESVPSVNFLRDFMGLPLSATVDLGGVSDSIGDGVGKSMVVIESRDLDCDMDEFLVTKKETRRMRGEVCTHSERKNFRISEGLEAFKGASIGTVVVDSDEDQMFDKMPLKNPVVYTGLGESLRVIDADSGGDLVYYVRRHGLKKGSSENTDIEVVDLDKDCDLAAGEQGSNMAPIENFSTRAVDLDEDKVCSNLPMTNAEVTDVDENETCDDILMRDIETEMLCAENAGTEVADVDKQELHNNLTTSNLVGRVGLCENEEVLRDVNTGLSKQVDGTKEDENCQKGVDIGDENREFSEKCFEKIDRDLHMRNLNLENDLQKRDEVCRDGNRELAHKDIDLPKGGDIHQKGTREFPSSLRKVAYITFDKGNTIEDTKGESFENNINKIDKSNCVGQNSRGVCDLPSSISGETESDPIMKNLLDALDLISGCEKEKMDNDVSYEGLDLWATAMMRGMKFPYPHWWPPPESDD